LLASSRPPTIYEINTWVWLSGLSARDATSIDLSTVPAAEWDAIAGYGFDAVWLMGVWERSPAGIAIANRNPALLSDFSRSLPDFRPEDNVGSAYCVRAYVVDPHLGGPAGLAIARRELARRGISLLLDFIPNHMAPDAPWIIEHPEHFMQGTAADLEAQPDAFLQVGTRIFACGKDPYFAPWPDVVQLNAFHPGFRQAVIAQLLAIVEQCDGIRCDMAMLLLNDVFARTWGGRAGPIPATDYWPEVIQAIRLQSPQFLFVAEAYWDLEWLLQTQGFDYCYDKRLYDRLEHGDCAGVVAHLTADRFYQQKLLRFIENHDEPRAAVSFAGRERAAAVTMATVPGAKLFHEGQCEGRRIRVPVFLGRRPQELVNQETRAFYERLLATIGADVFREGSWKLCQASGWPDNASYENLGAWCWTLEHDRRLILVNLTDRPVQARVHVPWDDLEGNQWDLSDALSDARFLRDGSEIQSEGLYVEVAPGLAQILQFSTS
jgi:hypothetical protein